LTPKGSISVKGGDLPVTIDGDGFYNSIYINNNCELIIDIGNTDSVMRIENLNMPQGKITLHGNGRLTLYIDNIANLKGYINASESKGNNPPIYGTTPLTIYADSLSSMSNETAIGGSLYAKNSNGSFSLSGGASINGDIYTNASSINVSAGVYVNGNIHSGNSSVALSGGAEVTGDIYTSGPSVNLSGGVEIGGSIYSGNTDIIFSGGATVNGNIVTAGDTVNMSGGTDIVNGVLYAPRAQVILSGGADIGGALIADIINMSGGPSITYNSDVIRDNPVIVDGSSITFEMGYWR
jgi:hypothetical protein